MMDRGIKPKVLVALGDSLTYGFPFDPGCSWVEALRQKTGWKVVNAGVSGDTLADMYERLETDVFEHQPDYVTLLGGTNDIFQGMSPPQLRQDFLSITSALRRRDIAVLVGLPLPVDDQSTEGVLKLWRAWLQEYCHTEKLTVLDFYSDFIDAAGQIKEELLLDGCHPRISGYQTMARRAIATFLPISDKYRIIKPQDNSSKD